MAKQRTENAPPAALWKDTFSDLMNLLLCFFVLMFAMSNIDSQKFEEIAASLSSSFSVLPQGGSALSKEGILVSSGASQLNELSNYYNNMGLNNDGDMSQDVQNAYEEIEKEGLEQSENMAEEIVDKYLAKGKDDIVYILPKQNLIKSDEIIEGIKDTYKKYNKEFTTDQIVTSSSHYENTYPNFVEYFKNHKHDLVFCGYDKDGVAIINAAQENGIKIPEEMEVVGMLNTSYSIMCKPTLSSMNVPVYDMGALAVRLLTKFLQDEEITSKEIAVQHMFIKRNSTND